MATIEYFKIEIKPWEYPMPGDNYGGLKVFEITLQVDGQRYFKKQAIQPDDLKSYLDIIFDRAKAELLKAISDQQEQSRDQ